MSFGYVTIDGERVEARVAADFHRMNEWFHSVTGYWLHINSGTRTRAEQEYLYNGWINRLPGFNLAAKPGYSNHEESGPIGPRALDLRDSGPDAGVMTIGTYRSNLLADNCHRFNFDNAGHYFNPREGWHYEWTGVFSEVGGGTGGSLPIDEKVLREQQFLNAARGEALVPDGIYGSATKAAYERYQVFLRDNYGYTDAIDGIWGPNTQEAHARYYADWTATQYPGFPLPAGYYFGPADGPAESISGMYSYQGALKPWQQRMKDRGWDVGDIDGIYGPKVAAVATSFQQEKGYTVDGLIGPETWNGAWTAPITPPPGTPPVPADPVPNIPPMPQTPDNPRGLATYSPVYPGAYIGLMAPLGDGPRGFKGEENTPVPIIIDLFALHRTGTNGDDTDWFSYKNSRSSCPNVHVLTDGRAKEFIRPAFKPALTGPEYNWRSFGIEIQGAGDGNDKQFERVADILAWLASFDGKELDGIPVDFKLTRAYVKNHRELIPGTECPGDWWADHMDALINRAKTILAEKYAPKPPTPGDTMVSVPKSFLINLQLELEASSDEIQKYL